MEPSVNFILLAFLAATAIAIVRMTNLFAVAMLSGIYSLLSAGLFVVLDAVDVAFTEAAVGAGITTVLMLGTLALTRREELPPKRWIWLPLGAVVVTGAALIYGTLDAPHFADATAPAHNHVAPEYLADAVPQYGEPTAIGVPNIVTNVLASYRGYDTLGEVVVIFTAGVGVLLLLGYVVRREDEPVAEAEADAGSPPHGPEVAGDAADDREAGAAGDEDGPADGDGGRGA